MDNILSYELFESAPAVKFDIRDYEYSPGKASPQIKKVVAVVDGDDAGYITYAPLGYITTGMYKSARKADVLKEGEKGVEMSLLLVDEKFRGLGLAHRLFDEFIRIAKEQDYKIAVLEAKDRQDNNMSKKDLQAMYKKWGFRHLAGKYFYVNI